MKTHALKGSKVIYLPNPPYECGCGNLLIPRESNCPKCRRKILWRTARGGWGRKGEKALSSLQNLNDKILNEMTQKRGINQKINRADYAWIYANVPGRSFEEKLRTMRMHTEQALTTKENNTSEKKGLRQILRQMIREEFEKFLSE